MDAQSLRERSSFEGDGMSAPSDEDLSATFQRAAIVLLCGRAERWPICSSHDRNSM